MENDTREFLIRIANTIGITLLWMMINLLFGIYFNWAFFEDSPRIGNIIYYLVFLVSLAGLIYFYYRLWKGKL